MAFRILQSVPQRTGIVTDFLPELGRVNARDHVDEVGGGWYGGVVVGCRHSFIPLKKNKPLL